MYDDDLAATTRALAHELQLVRPLAVFDLETTGVNIEDARTVEIAVGGVPPCYRRGRRQKAAGGVSEMAPATVMAGATEAGTGGSRA